MHRRVTVALLLLLTVLMVSANADDAEPRKVALLVGVNQYLKPGFKPLSFAEADVTAVGEELQKLGFEVTILLGSESGARQATLANIEAAASKMVKPLSQQDVALVMLSGHGQQLNPILDSDPNKVDFDRTQSFYCPVDAVMNAPETQFSLSHLVDDILAPNVGRKLLLVDACRDIPLDRTRGIGAKGIEGRVVALPEGTGVFFSCSAGQTSFEREELKHGLFTYCLLEGLRGKAVVEGVLEWDSLVAHVNRRMHQQDLTRYMPERRPQVPIRAGSLPYTVLGSIDKRSMPPAPKDTARHQLVILHACSAGEICLEAEDENGGLFSSAYQRMLAKARAAGDEVDFAELADGVRTDVTNYVRLNKLDRQTPTIVGTLEPSKLSVSGRKVIAITVGVDRNADPDYPPLRFAASDARRVGTELRQWGADVRQLTGKVGEEDAATKAKILAAIEQAVLENASVLFVHFAGNGIQDPQTLKQSLLPADGRLDVPASLLQVEELQTALTPFPGTVILSIDACRSNSPVAAVASDKSPAPPAPPPSPR